jgi:betaine-aldehyde dehydrogenase
MPATLSRSTREIISPVTEEVIASIPDQSAAQVDKAVLAAAKAFPSWASKTPGERSALLFKWAQLLEDNLLRLAELESKNTGKPLKLAKDGDLPFAIDNLRFFAGACRALEGSASGEYAGGYTSVIRREPLGVVGLVAPWNYPLMMGVWKLGPALAAGNTAVLKPSELTPLTTIELVKLAHQAGIPADVVSCVTGAEETGKALTSHPLVRMVSFTGDTDTGRKIMAQAAPTLKRVHMELGGKAPFVVFEDADLDAAVKGATVAGFVNCGQDCTAATRIYVQQGLLKKFSEAYAAEVKKIRVGVDMGPLISSEQRGRVEGFLKMTRGKVLTGGKRPSAFKKGWFFEPTVIHQLEQKDELVQKEIFGPVTVVLPFKDEADAVLKANDTEYGLAGSVWTKDVQRALRMSAAIQAGTVWVNDHLPICSEMPHGGFKQSGFGKDMSKYAVEEYTAVKHVMFDTTGAARKPWHYTAYGDPS